MKGIFCFIANCFAQVSIPLAPPDTISVVPLGRYFSRAFTTRDLEPIIAVFI